MSIMPRILLITNSYPSASSKERNFVHDEVDSFIKNGLSVTVMPYHFDGNVDSEFKGELLTNLSQRDALVFIYCAIKMFFRLSFWREILCKFPTIFSSFKRLKNFFRISLKSELVFRTLKKVRCNDYEILYTYWCVGECVALINISNNSTSDFIKVSRMHGFDINEERDFNDGYIPYRDLVLPKLDKIILLSNQAKSYLVSKYPYVLEKIVISPLGVNTLKNINNIRWCNHCVTFFSCSYPSPVKRLDKIHKVVSGFARLNPSKSIYWCHFGCTANDINFGDSGAPGNLKVSFRGRVDKSVFMREYISAKTPVFINMSDSEGQPVSIMEAMSCGLPVIATDVGGVSEVLGEDSGILVDTEETALFIADKIRRLTINESNYRFASFASLSRRQEYYDVQKNHYRLSEQIRTWCE